MQKTVNSDWRDIPGYGGKYQVNYFAEVRRVYPSGSTRMMTPYKRKNGKNPTRKKLYVKLTKDGKSTAVGMLKIMVDTFLKTPPGKVPYHKDGDITNNWLSNIAFADRKTLGKLTGAQSRRMPVVKIDRMGQPVDVYPSARSAARANHMSYQTVLDRCNQKVKRPYALDGHDYRFEL